MSCELQEERRDREYGLLYRKRNGVERDDCECENGVQICEQRWYSFRVRYLVVLCLLKSKVARSTKGKVEARHVFLVEVCEGVLIDIVVVNHATDSDGHIAHEFAGAHVALAVNAGAQSSGQR